MKSKILPNLYKEADDRYKREKPPGFMDAKEKEDERKYGDFILWKQILEFAKKESRPIIFVTGEKKVDWWIKKNGKIISPHVELRREFHEYVHQPFWMYQTQDFLQIAKDKLMVEIDQKSIEETNAIADIELVDEQDNDTLRQAVAQIVKPNYVQQLSEQMKAVAQIVKPNYVQQLIEQMKVPSSALHQAQERMKVLEDNSTFQLNPRIEKLISETITTRSPENGKLQEIDTPASNNEPTTSPILDRPQEEAEESKSQSKSKRRSPSKKRNDSNLKNSNN